MRSATLIGWIMACVVSPMTAPVFAQEKACILQGEFELAGQVVLIDDCAENIRMPPEHFREACKGMSQFTLAGDTFQARLSFASACPPAPQGVCEGIFGGMMDAHYYNRDQTTLAETRSSCLAQNARWR